MRLLIALGYLAYTIQAALPPGCIDLTQHPLDGADPAAIFGTNSEIGAKAPPIRIGNLRSRGPIPTQNFITNQIKPGGPPLRLFPYEAVVTKDGVTYDAYTMDRWSDPARTDLMDQQSAWERGKPWNRLNNLGSNMKQMVAGPDGNPMGVFEGHSGIQVGIAGSGEPELTDFGDLYGNFLYRAGGGSMEVPIVRGATLLTHIFHNANPVIRPYCLSSINGQQVNFNCPIENSAADGGSGFLEGHCNGNTLTIILHNTKEVHDVEHVQYAAEQAGNWGRRAMHNCDAQHCRASDGGKTITITVPNASGTMSFAINYIGHYVVPWDWGNHPSQARCGAKREEAEREFRSKRAPEDISVHAKCSAGQAELRVDVAGNNIPGVDKIQYAINTQGNWGSGHGMTTCDAAHCSRQGSEIVIKLRAPGDPFRVAFNVIGFAVLPPGDWVKDALTVHCNNQVVSAGHNSPPGGNTNPGNPNNPGTSTGGGTATHNINQNTKFLLELREPGTARPGETRKFVLYFSAPVTATASEGQGTVTFHPQGGGTYNGLVQLGYLGHGAKGNNPNANFLDKYAGRYSYKPKLSMCVEDGSRKVFMNFDWHAVDAGGQPTGQPVLMVAMPHHELQLTQSASHLLNTPYGFKGYEGNFWLMQMDAPYAPMDPEPAALARVKANPGQTKDIVDAIGRDAKDANLVAMCAHSDSYNVGKEIGMNARLASLSRAFGTNHFNALDEAIRSCLEKWLRIDDTLENLWKFHYDTTWGGLFLRATNGNLDFGTDYGFPYYNDHHFHLGYFIYAMAYYSKHHPDWARAHRDRMLLVARDVGNPSPQDRFFPVVRHKDMYTGFSWASGIAPGERQEESASESINCYHGLAALGDALGDNNLRHTGQAMLALELLSVREYWQVRQHNRQHFPPMFQNIGVVGQIAENAWYVYTLDWPCDPNRFPMRHGCLVGIQIIPITAASKYWVDQEWAASIRQTCEYAINPHSAPDYAKADPADQDLRELGVGWKAFCWVGIAHLDADHNRRAADYLRDKSARNLVGGTGAASTLLFIYGST